ncbi:MAG: hypothetical protein GC192_22620 [Bacteroidetes bacterium]|nr:hypothetical protein [Bacteroidota bacterium]
MSNQILDAPEYSFEEIRKNLLKAGLTQVYESKGAIIVKQTDEVRVKIKQEGNGYQVVTMLPPIGNGAQAFITVPLAFLLGFLGIRYFLFIAVVAGLPASYLYYLPKSKKLRDEVEKAIGSEAI